MTYPDFSKTRADIEAAMRANPPVLKIPPIDWGPIIEGFATLSKAYQKAMQSMMRTFRSFNVAVRQAANDEIRVSGLEARYYVRGGLECSLTVRGVPLLDIDVLVRQLMTRPASAAPEDEALMMRLLTRESRARLAASAIRGYVEHVDGPAPVITAWYRWYRGVEVIVRRAS